MAYQVSMFDEPPQMEMAAVFDPTSDYRVELTRVWDESRYMLVVCMLNPSTANDHKNDPTLLALIHFAKLWGYGGLIVVNLYSFCSPSPAVMWKAADPVGRKNDLWIGKAIAYAERTSKTVLVAWGSFDDLTRVVTIIEDCMSRNIKMICLGTNRDGSPKHPMARGRHRIPRDQQPVPWEPI